MTVTDIVIVALAAGVVILSVWLAVRRRQRGNGGCGHHCPGCSMSHFCEDERNLKR